MINNLSDEILIRHSLSVIIEFMHEKFPEFKHRYYLGLKEKELSHYYINNSPNSEEYIKCLEELNYFKSVYGDGTYPLVEIKDNVVEIKENQE